MSMGNVTLGDSFLEFAGNSWLWVLIISASFVLTFVIVRSLENETKKYAIRHMEGGIVCKDDGTAGRGYVAYLLNQHSEAVEIDSLDEPEEKVNWVCGYCDSVNFAAALRCHNCNAPRKQPIQDGET